jgi:hypothetical protein
MELGQVEGRSDARTDAPWKSKENTEFLSEI